MRLEEDLRDQEVLPRSEKGPPGSKSGTFTLGGGAVLRVDMADLGRSTAPRMILSSDLVRSGVISDVSQ